MGRDALNWAAVHLVAFSVLYGLMLSAEACSRAFGDVEAAELETAPCECVIEVDDNRVPLVVSGRAVEVW